MLSITILLKVLTVRNRFAILNNTQNHSNIVQIGQKVIMLIMQIMQIAQHMQVSIRQFLNAGDPYYTFLT